MLKILIAFNGGLYPVAALEFALQLNKSRPILLTGVFIPQAAYSYLWNAAATVGSSAFPPLVEEVSSEVMEINIRKFRIFCKTNNIHCVVHKDIYDFALPELLKETRFSDLLLIQSGKFYESISEVQQNSHIKDLLDETECPVLMVPETFEFPCKNIIAYDGSASSVYAIKQFAYLFPELTSNETLLFFSKNDEERELPYETCIQELGSQHFQNLTLLKLHMDAKKYFATWINEERKAILISGSFGRSTISQLFRKSFLTDVIAEHHLPLFMAHN
jgi:hypothetical protein